MLFVFCFFFRGEQMMPHVVTVNNQDASVGDAKEGKGEGEGRGKREGGRDSLFSHLR